MNCMISQAKIHGFLNNQLNDTELEEFLLHIGNCSECKEELEIQYILSEAMKKMDKDEDISCNFHQMLQKDIEAATAHIQKKKRMNRWILLMAFALFIVAVTLSIMGILDLGGVF